MKKKCGIFFCTLNLSYGHNIRCSYELVNYQCPEIWNFYENQYFHEKTKVFGGDNTQISTHFGEITVHSFFLFGQDLDLSLNKQVS